SSGGVPTAGSLAFSRSLALTRLLMPAVTDGQGPSASTMPAMWPLRGAIVQAFGAFGAAALATVGAASASVLPATKTRVAPTPTRLRTFFTISSPSGRHPGFSGWVNTLAGTIAHLRADPDNYANLRPNGND